LLFLKIPEDDTRGLVLRERISEREEGRGGERVQWIKRTRTRDDDVRESFSYSTSLLQEPHLKFESHSLREAYMIFDCHCTSSLLDTLD